MTSNVDIEAIVEAALFATAEPLSRKRLSDLFPDDDNQDVQAAIDAVLERYKGDEGRGVRAEEVAGGLRIVTRPQLHAYLKRLFDLSGRNRLSMAALETLAIVAYRQPITGPEIQELRSVNPSGVLKTLLERRLIRIAGRKMVVGKPFLYATTRDFLMHFGLRSLEDLPPLEEFEELLGRMEEKIETPSADLDDEEIRRPEPVGEIRDQNPAKIVDGDEEE